MSEIAQTFGQKVISFNASLRFDAKLPPDIEVMNPFQNNQCATPASIAFYDKYYGDNHKRHMILGINPGRFGAGLTGVPFTDPKRLKEICRIDIPACPAAHEPSSLFVYEVIAAYGGAFKFYGDWYINSLSPLGFTRKGKSGKFVNCNYYDDPELAQTIEPFMKDCLGRQMKFGIFPQVCICLGTGKNADFMKKFNERHKFFKRIEPLEHPRYIIQYRWKERHKYVGKYLETFENILKTSPQQ